eukprot:g20063.t1
MSTELYLTLVNSNTENVNVKVNEMKNNRMFIYRRHGRVDSEVLDVHYLLDPELRIREAGRGDEFLVLPVPFALTISYGSNPSFLSPFDVRAKMEVAIAFRGNGFGGSGDVGGHGDEAAASRPFGVLGLLTKPRVGSVVVEKKVYREQEQFDRTGASRIVKVLAGIRKELVKFAVLPAELKREVEREQAREQRRRQAALEAGRWGVEPDPAAAAMANDRDERVIGSSMSDEEADDEEEEYAEASTRLQNTSREHEHDVLIPRPAAIVFRKLGITPLQGLNRRTMMHHTSPEWTFGPHTVRVWRVAEDVPEVEVAEEQRMKHQLQAPGSGAVEPGGPSEKLVKTVDEEEQEMKFLERGLQRLRLDDVAAAVVDDEEGEKKAKVVRLQPLREALLAGLPRDDEALLRELQLQWNYSPPEDQGPAGGAPSTSAIVPQNGAPDSVDDLETKHVFGGIASACVRGPAAAEAEPSRSLEKHDHDKSGTSADGLFAAEVAPSFPHQLPGSVSPSDEWTPEMETPEAEAGEQDQKLVLQAGKKSRTGAPAHQDRASDLGGSAIPRRAEDFDQELFDPKNVLVLWADFLEDEQGRTQEPVQITRLVHGMSRATIMTMMKLLLEVVALGMLLQAQGAAWANAKTKRKMTQLLRPLVWRPPNWLRRRWGAVGSAAPICIICCPRRVQVDSRRFSPQEAQPLVGRGAGRP